MTFDVMLFFKLMKMRLRIKTISVIILLPVAILSACQAAETTEAPLATQTGTAITTPSAYPPPEETEPPEVTSVAYPGSEVPATTSVAYPGPGANPAADLTAEAYPQPGAPLGDAYPQPEGTQEPYPGPGSGQPLGTPAAGIQPTNTPAAGIQPTATPAAGTQPTGVPGAPTQALTPTTTPTLGLLRTELVASDPKSFRIASGRYQLVEFFAFWSPESQSMAPVMSVLEQRYSNRMRFVYLDIDDTANSLFKTLLANRLPPVFFLLDGGGNLLHEWQGYLELDAFDTTIAELVP